LTRYSRPSPSRTKSQSYEPSSVCFTTYPFEFEWIRRRSTSRRAPPTNLHWTRTSLIPSSTTRSYAADSVSGIATSYPNCVKVAIARDVAMSPFRCVRRTVQCYRYGQPVAPAHVMNEVRKRRRIERTALLPRYRRECCGI